MVEENKTVIYYFKISIFKDILKIVLYIYNFI